MRLLSKLKVKRKYILGEKINGKYNYIKYGKSFEERKRTVNETCKKRQINKRIIMYGSQKIMKFIGIFQILKLIILIIQMIE